MQDATTWGRFEKETVGNWKREKPEESGIEPQDQVTGAQRVIVHARDL